MTEEEAKTKWCPMARVSTYSEGNPAESAANRADEGIPYVGSRCIASDCMMWRYKTNRQMGYPRNPDDPCLRAGYCGLGGKS